MNRTLIPSALAILAGAIFAASHLIPPSLAADSAVSGRVSVIDGDTIDLHGERIRLDGIDAPESWQRCEGGSGKPYRCGKAAADALDRFLAASRPTTCVITATDRYGRFVARCQRADGKSVNAWLVRNGWALDWVKYSGGDFAADEKAAKTEKRGIWRGKFQTPCEARAARSKREPHC